MPVHSPRWFTDGGEGLQHLGTLTRALDEVAVGIRLANDLATFSWERAQPGHNNILMYDISPERVRTELAHRADSVRRLLAPLTAQGLGAAVELLRFLEWSISFYALADFRGWGADVAVTAPVSTASREECQP